ncbi:hypothetical protein HanPI659440_Chr17g0685291 [Helianthus annuus]|nr:hypothetical protein HanPI659440_Chr17g0685291 [Helianthus annuus]
MLKPGPSNSVKPLVNNAGSSLVAKSSEKTVVVHEETSAFFFFQGIAVLGRSVDFVSLTGMKENLKEVDCKIYYVGGFNLLLLFKEDFEASEFLENQEAWKKWFSHLDMWNGQAGAYERLAWLKIVGVPVHLAENKVFNDVAGHFGKVVHKSQLSEEVQDLSINRVGVLVDVGFPISDTVTLVWRNKKCKVWVQEKEEADWLPDCCLVNDKWPESMTDEEDGESTQFGSVHRMEDWREEVEKVGVHGGDVEVLGDSNNGGNSNVLGGITRVDGHQQPFFGSLEKVGKKKKKPFNLLKDKHLSKPKPTSPVLMDRPKKRLRTN